MYAIPAGDKTNMVGQYIMAKVPGFKLTPGMYTAFAFLNDNGEFVGGATISNYREAEHGNDCELACAVENATAFRHGVFKAVFTYIFVHLKCVRVTCVTTKRNARARKFIEALGFVLEGCIRLGYDGRRDALIYGLLGKDCRYLEGRGNDGEEVRTESAAAA